MLQAFDRIQHSYADPQRRFHTLSAHIRILLKLQKEYFADASLPVVLAIWFHDIFYLPGYGHSETVSADMMRAILHGIFPKAIIDAACTLDAIRAVRLTLDPMKMCVRLGIGDAGLLIAADGGGGGDTVSADYNGKEISVGINAQYMIDILDTLNGSVELTLVSPDMPVFLRPVGDDSFLGFVMTMRLAEKAS
jgi:hypothetical protein